MSDTTASPPLLLSQAFAGSRFRAIVTLFVVWTAIGIFLAVPNWLISRGWWDVAAKVIEAWVWALFTPAIFMVDRRLSRANAGLWRRVAVLILLSVPICFAHTYVTATVQYPLKDIWYNPLRTPSYVGYYFLNGWLTYCAIIGAIMAVEYYRFFMAGQLQLERVEKRLLESHLNTLRMQLEPHFLFNALNAISSEVISNPELARDMIEDLGALLRLSLDYQDNQEIPLSQEIVLLEHYLAIQRVRFGDRIQTEICVDSDVLTVRVPSMLLQPIVENAIRHGLGKSMLGGFVTVSASRAGDLVELRVEDDGVGLPQGWQMEASKGLGLRVTRERLEGLYPNIDHSFEIRRRAAGGTEAIIRVPVRTTEADNHGKRTG